MGKFVNSFRSEIRILLINPPRSPYNAILHYAPDEAKQFIHKKLIGPPLGLLTVAAAVKEYSVTLLEMKGEYDLHPEAPAIEQLTLTWLEKTNPQIVGISIITSELPVSLEILRTVKKYNPSIITVAGGLHPTLCPQDLNDPSVDIIVPGMAAHTFRDIVRAIEQGAGICDVPGILVRTSGELKSTGPSIPVEPAGKDFIMPDRSFIKPWIDTYKVGNTVNPVTYLFTSLGCPYHCTFCSIWPQHAGQFMQRDIESIISELKTLDEYQVVRFADANTVVDAGFIERLFDRISRERISKEYVMDIRFDTVVKYPALISKMAKAGLKVVICGFESFRQKELERYNKSASSAMIEKAIAIFDSLGIMVRGNYVIPPDYSQDDFVALAQYAVSHKVVYAGYTILTPMPGTQLYTQQYQSIVDHDPAKYNFFNCVMKTALPLEEFYRSVGALWVIKKGRDVI